MWENHNNFWCFSPSIALLLSLLPPVLLLLNSQSHRHMWSNLSCVAEVLKTQQRKLSLANITQQGRKISCYHALEVAVSQAPQQHLHRDNVEPPCPQQLGSTGSQANAQGRQQPALLLGSAFQSELHSIYTVSFRLKNEKNSTPQCKVWWAFFPSLVVD